MNKNMFSAALIASLAVPFTANADVKVYGAASVEVNSYSRDGTNLVDTGPAEKTNVGEGKNALLLEDNARGRLGVKGSEDLGNGLTGVFKWEWKTDTSDNDVSGTSVSLSGRESMVGLKGDFGLISLGTLKSPYKYMGGVKYDAFLTTASEARRNGGMSGGAFGHNGFLVKSVGFNSPKVNGLQAQVVYRLDEGGDPTDNASGEEGGSWVLGVKYNQGPIEAFVVALDQDNAAAGGNSYSATKVGGKYTSGPMSVMGQYEMIDDKGTDVTVLFVAGHYKIDKTTFVAQFGQNDVDDAAGVDAETYLAAGLVHKFTKSTRTTVSYRSSSELESVISISLRKDFSTK